MSDFWRVTHPHRVLRNALGPVKVDDLRGDGGIAGRFNARFGLGITKKVGTMWCAYAFTALALISAPKVFGSGDAVLIVAWITQTFIQLVLLPIIIVGQNVQSKAADRRASQTFNDVEVILHEFDQLHARLDAQ